jgi:hypothetical protein
MSDISMIESVVSFQGLISCDKMKCLTLGMIIGRNKHLRMKGVA